MIVSEDVKIKLGGVYYLLEKGDNIKLMVESVDVVEPMFPIHYAKFVLKQLGLPTDFHFLGHGENGYVFKCGNKIIKVTSDESEYHVGKQLKLLSKSHLIDVFGVSMVNVKLSKPPKWWIKYWGGAMDGWETLQSMYVIIAEYVRPLSGRLSEQVDNIIDIIDSGGVPPRNNISKQLLDMIDQLRSLGAKTYDIRSENIGFKDGMLKLMDLGAY